MGLDDEAEKLRQAEEWLKDGSRQQREAALDHVGWIICHSVRPDMRGKAWKLLHLLNEKDASV